MQQNQETYKPQAETAVSTIQTTVNEVKETPVVAEQVQPELSQAQETANTVGTTIEKVEVGFEEANQTTTEEKLTQAQDSVNQLVEETTNQNQKVEEVLADFNQLPTPPEETPEVPEEETAEAAPTMSEANTPEQPVSADSTMA